MSQYTCKTGNRKCKSEPSQLKTVVVKVITF